MHRVFYLIYFCINLHFKRRISPTESHMIGKKLDLHHCKIQYFYNNNKISISPSKNSKQKQWDFACF